MIELLLPWPPSANVCWRHVGGRVLISEAGRVYRTKVARKVTEARSSGEISAQPMRNRIAVAITAYPPDNHRRDIDNLLKQPLDALTHAKVWTDDSQIDCIAIKRGPVCEHGWLLVEVSELPLGSRACAREDETAAA